MSILIEGMEMPKAQFQKSSTLYHVEGTIFVYPDGKARAELSVDYNERKSYPIIPVHEPHGRLIDADAIPYKKIMYDDDDFYYGVTKPYIDRIPTVIPASESKERHAFLPQYELTPPSEEG